MLFYYNKGGFLGAGGAPGGGSGCLGNFTFGNFTLGFGFDSGEGGALGGFTPGGAGGVFGAGGAFGMGGLGGACAIVCVVNNITNK